MPHRVRGDRIDHVRVLRLVEQPVHEPRRVEPEVLADQPAARAVGQPGAQQQLRRVQRPAGDDDHARVDAPARFRRRSTYSTPVASPSSITTRSTRASARSSSSPAAHASWMYVLSVDLPAFVGQPLEARAAAHAVARPCTTSPTRARMPSARNAGLDRAHAPRPVVPLAHAEARLDAVVVRREVGRPERRAAVADEPARRVPLGEVLRRARAAPPSC